MKQHQAGAPSPDRPDSSSWRRLGGFVKPILPRLIMGFACALGAGIVALAIPQVLSTLVNTVLYPGGDAAALRGTVLLIAVLGFAEALLVFMRRVFVITPAARLETQLRIGFFRHLQQLPVAFHDKWGSGQLLSRSMSDLGLLRRWLAFGAVMLVVASVTVILGLALMFSSNWILGTIYLIGAVPITVRAYRFRDVFRTASRLSQDQAGDLATAVEESVHGIRVIKAFGRSGHMLDGFKARAQELRSTEIGKARSLSGFLAFIVSVPEITLGLGLLIGIWLTAQGQLSVGALVAYFATAAVLAGPVEGIGMLLGMTLTTKTALDRHFEVLDTPNDIASPADPASPQCRLGTLEFDDVGYAYAEAPAGTAPVLRGVDLRLEPGETMALVGATGSGKSTLLALVPRLYEVGSGSVRVDGIDVRDYDLHELRSAVSVAFEDTTLFSASIRENVMLGYRPDPGEDPEAVLAEALDTAQGGFVHDLPAGLDTVIGEEGLSLSGGQRQRLALARAIAARPRVLVLDDPLSALDVNTEERVTAALRRVLRGTTTLIVAHRPSTVALADRVALLRDGAIQDVGTHAELLLRSSHYRHIISSPRTQPSPEDLLDESEPRP